MQNREWEAAYSQKLLGKSGWGKCNVIIKAKASVDAGVNIMIPAKVCKGIFPHII